MAKRPADGTVVGTYIIEASIVITDGVPQATLISVEQNKRGITNDLEWVRDFGIANDLLDEKNLGSIIWQKLADIIATRPNRTRSDD